MKHVLSACGGFLARTRVANIAFDELEPVDSAIACSSNRVVEVGATASTEVVEPRHPLPQSEQPLDQMRPDEPCCAGYKPACGRFGYGKFDFGDGPGGRTGRFGNQLRRSLGPGINTRRARYQVRFRSPPATS